MYLRAWDTSSFIFVIFGMGIRYCWIRSLGSSNLLILSSSLVPGGVCYHIFLELLRMALHLASIWPGRLYLVHLCRFGTEICKW